MCEWMWERARSCGRGSPRSPAESAGEGGGQAAPQPLAVGPARQAFSSPLPGGSRRARPPWFTELAQPGSRGVLLLRSPRRKRRRKAGAPPRQLGDLFSVGETLQPPPRSRFVRRARKSPVRSRPPRRRAGQTPQSLGGGRGRSHRLPERTAAVRPGIGGWLAVGAPEAGAPLSVVLKPRSPPAPRRLVRLKSIIQISATASSSPSALRWVQQSPFRTGAPTHTRARAHTHTRHRICSKASPCASPTPRGTHSSGLREPQIQN